MFFSDLRRQVLLGNAINATIKEHNYSLDFNSFSDSLYKKKQASDFPESDAENLRKKVRAAFRRTYRRTKDEKVRAACNNCLADLGRWSFSELAERLSSVHKILLSKDSGYAADDAETRSRLRKRVIRFAKKHRIAADKAALITDKPGRCGRSRGKYAAIILIAVLFAVLPAICFDIPFVFSVLLFPPSIRAVSSAVYKLRKNGKYAERFPALSAPPADFGILPIVICGNIEDGRRLADRLECLYLADNNSFTEFCLFLDYSDSPTRETDADAFYLSDAAEAIEKLVKKYGRRFTLIVRKREYDPKSGGFLGKSGRVPIPYDFSSLCKNGSESCDIYVGTSDRLGSAHFALFLPDGKSLYDNFAKKLVCLLFHPDNMAVTENGTVIGGYGGFYIGSDLYRAPFDTLFSDLGIGNPENAVVYNTDALCKIDISEKNNYCMHEKLRFGYIGQIKLLSTCQSDPRRYFSLIFSESSEHASALRNRQKKRLKDRWGIFRLIFNCTRDMSHAAIYIIVMLSAILAAWAQAVLIFFALSLYIFQFAIGVFKSLNRQKRTKSIVTETKKAFFAALFRISAVPFSALCSISGFFIGISGIKKIPKMSLPFYIFFLSLCETASGITVLLYGKSIISSLLGMCFITFSPIYLYLTKVKKTLSVKKATHEKQIAGFAETSWSYFESFNGNIAPAFRSSPSTCSGSDYTTPKVLSGAMLAALSAYDMKIIDVHTLFLYTSNYLSFIEKIPKNDGLPYCAYYTESGEIYGDTRVDIEMCSFFICALAVLKSAFEHENFRIDGADGLCERISDILCRMNLKKLFTDASNDPIVYPAVCYAVANRKIPTDIPAIVRNNDPDNTDGAVMQLLFLPIDLLSYTSDSIGKCRILLEKHQRQIKSAKMHFSGRSESSVGYIYPYYQFLCLPLSNGKAYENLCGLSSIGAYGKYGFFDRVYIGKSDCFDIDRINDSFHQAISVIAADNCLNGMIIQKRFMYDKAMKAFIPFFSRKVGDIPVIGSYGSDYSLRRVIRDRDTEKANSVPQFAVIAAEGGLSALVSSIGHFQLIYRKKPINPACFDRWDMSVLGESIRITSIRDSAFDSFAYAENRIDFSVGRLSVTLRPIEGVPAISVTISETDCSIDFPFGKKIGDNIIFSNGVFIGWLALHGSFIITASDSICGTELNLRCARSAPCQPIACISSEYAGITSRLIAASVFSFDGGKGSGTPEYEPYGDIVIDSSALTRRGCSEILESCAGYLSDKGFPVNLCFTDSHEAKRRPQTGMALKLSDNDSARQLPADSSYSFRTFGGEKSSESKMRMYGDNNIVTHVGEHFLGYTEIMLNRKRQPLTPPPICSESLIIGECLYTSDTHDILKSSRLEATESCAVFYVDNNGCNFRISVGCSLSHRVKLILVEGERACDVKMLVRPFGHETFPAEVEKSTDGSTELYRRQYDGMSVFCTRCEYADGSVCFILGGFYEDDIENHESIRSFFSEKTSVLAEFSAYAEDTRNMFGSITEERICTPDSTRQAYLHALWKSDCRLRDMIMFLPFSPDFLKKEILDYASGMSASGEYESEKLWLCISVGKYIEFTDDREILSVTLPYSDDRYNESLYMHIIRILEGTDNSSAIYKAAFTSIAGYISVPDFLSDVKKSVDGIPGDRGDIQRKIAFPAEDPYSLEYFFSHILCINFYPDRFVISPIGCNSHIKTRMIRNGTVYDIVIHPGAGNTITIDGVRSNEFVNNCFFYDKSRHLIEITVAKNEKRV